MKKVSVIVAAALLSAVFLFDAQSTGQTKYKGRLPSGWGKLGLNGAQKQEIYKIQTMYRGKIKDLEEQITMLKRQERGEMVKVLTEEQKQQLTKQILGTSGSSKKGTQSDS